MHCGVGSKALNPLIFGEHIKLVEALINRSSPGQIDRNIRMNGHGQRFPAIIGMVEL